MCVSLIGNPVVAGTYVDNTCDHGRRQSAAETIDFRRGYGSGDGSSFQGSSDRSPRPWTRQSISLDSSLSRAVAVVFSEPDLALEPANCVRRLHYSALSGRFAPRPCSSFDETVVRDDQSPRL